MAIDLQKLQQKFDMLLNDPNFVTDFEQWLKTRDVNKPDTKLPFRKNAKVKLLTMHEEHKGKHFTVLRYVSDDLVECQWQNHVYYFYENELKLV